MSFALIGSMFLEGVLSFFSPCILPVLPLYFGYLSSGAKTVDSEGNVSYKRLKVFVTTCFFVLGISFAIILMAVTLQSFKAFFNDYSLILSFIGSFILILLGLVQCNVIVIKPLLSEKKLNIPLDLSKMNFLKAFAFGFIFSFSWTPCIGPMLTSALVMCTEANASGYVYIGAYIIGFVFIFLLIGLFLEEVLNLINAKKNIFKYTPFIGGILILCMGFYMFYSASKTVISLENNGAIVEETETITEDTVSDENATDMEKYNFTVKTSKGNSFTLTDTMGKHTVIIFFRTWCSYCKTEITELAEIKNEYPDVTFYLMTSPNSGDEGDETSIEDYLEENNVDYEVLYDEGMSVQNMYGVSGYPTSFFYSPDGSIYGYLPGYADSASWKEILDDFLK